MLSFGIKISKGMIPSRCLAMCKGKQNRFGFLHSGELCSCFDTLPLHDLVPLPQEQCNKPCSADTKQVCGGFSSSIGETIHIILVFATLIKSFTAIGYTASCEYGWNRFLDSCYKPLEKEGSIEQNENSCAHKGGHLWSPKSFEELEFIELMIADSGTKSKFIFRSTTNLVQQF